jgi:hypothetical protein
VLSIIKKQPAELTTGCLEIKNTNHFDFMKTRVCLLPIKTQFYELFNTEKVRRPFLQMPPKFSRTLDTGTNRAQRQKYTSLFGYVVS